jgi:hypothetical protein
MQMKGGGVAVLKSIPNVFPVVGQPEMTTPEYI